VPEDYVFGHGDMRLEREDAPFLWTAPGRFDSRDDIPKGCPLPDGSGGADANTANPTNSAAAADPAMEKVPPVTPPP